MGLKARRLAARGARKKGEAESAEGREGVSAARRKGDRAGGEREEKA